MTHRTCDHGCSEYRGLTRRTFLGWSAGALGALTLPTWLPRVVYADSHDSGRDVLVQIFLRGGWDSLSACVPYQESSYYDLRPTLAIPAPGGGAESAVDLDGFFAFAPAMAPLLDAYQSGDLLVVHACGSNDPTRSHFDAMHAIEVGIVEPGQGAYTGWLANHLVATSATSEEAVLRALGLGVGLPRTLVGAPATVPVPSLEALGFAGDPATAAERKEVLAAMYAVAQDPLQTAAAATLETVALLEQIDVASYAPNGGATYPEGELGMALRSTAALLRGEVGVEAVTIDFGGWDTHDAQSPLGGRMAGLMSQLSGALAAFHADILGTRRDVVVVVLSEFGRNVYENGSAGTDHGHGGAMMVLGGQVAGGRVLASWPGLDPELLHEGQDLAVTIDYRDVLAEILDKRLGNADAATVFPDPDYTPTYHGVVEAADEGGDSIRRSRAPSSIWSP
jgi:uncharacterized protein (DUF1501 family)